MRNVVFLVPFCFLSFFVFAQEDPVVWRQLKTITNEHYHLRVPENFRQIRNLGRGLEQFFEASGVGLPITFNQGPVIVTIFLMRESCSSLDDCKRQCLEGYRINRDRVFSADWQDTQEKLPLENGDEAWLLHTRFYRQSKGLHQSRFDLVASRTDFEGEEQLPRLRGSAFWTVRIRAFITPALCWSARCGPARRPG